MQLLSFLATCALLAVGTEALTAASFRHRPVSTTYRSPGSRLIAREPVVRNLFTSNPVSPKPFNPKILLGRDIQNALGELSYDDLAALAGYSGNGFEGYEDQYASQYEVSQDSGRTLSRRARVPDGVVQRIRPNPPAQSIFKNVQANY